jgi:hypothetical protein
MMQMLFRRPLFLVPEGDDKFQEQLNCSQTDFLNNLKSALQNP